MIQYLIINEKARYQQPLESTISKQKSQLFFATDFYDSKSKYHCYNGSTNNKEEKNSKRQHKSYRFNFNSGSY